MSRRKSMIIPGVSKQDRAMLNEICVNLGYKDLPDLISSNGCSSVKEFLSDFYFTSIRDFFVGFGWYERVEPFRKMKANSKGKGNRNFRGLRSLA